MGRCGKCDDDDLLHIQTWADNWNVMFDAAKRKNLTVSRLKDAETGHPSLTFYEHYLVRYGSGGTPGHVRIRKELFWTHLVDNIAKDA